MVSHRDIVLCKIGKNEYRLMVSGSRNQFVFIDRYYGNDRVLNAYVGPTFYKTEEYKSLNREYDIAIKKAQSYIILI